MQWLIPGLVSWRWVAKAQRRDVGLEVGCGKSWKHGSAGKEGAPDLGFRAVFGAPRIKKYKKNPLRAASLWAFRRSTAFKGSRKCASHTPSQIPSFNFCRTKRGLQVGDILGQWLLNVTHTKPCCASWQRRMSPWAWNLRGSWQALWGTQ